jgi:hypothetical protein
MKLPRIALLPVAAVLLLAGITAYFYATGRDYEEFVEEHGHAHHAPHGGTLILLGDHTAHIELVLDPEAGKLTAYLLDGHAEHPVRSTAQELVFAFRKNPEAPWQSIALRAVDNPLSGEKAGDTSEFSGTAEGLIGAETFQLRTPALELRGVTFAEIETSFPEGNE